MTFEIMTAADAIRRAGKLVAAFGWPALAPIDALKQMEKKMAPGDAQMALMWAICVRVAVRRRKAYSGLHPIIEIHVQDGQTAEGILEYMADCADEAEHHPLNGNTDAPPPPPDPPPVGT